MIILEIIVVNILTIVIVYFAYIVIWLDTYFINLGHDTNYLIRS